MEQEQKFPEYDDVVKGIEDKIPESRLSWTFKEWARVRDCYDYFKQQSCNEVQLLKNQIDALATKFNELGPGSCTGDHLNKFYELVIKLRQLSK